jgi:hypothetical protein
LLIVRHFPEHAARFWFSFASVVSGLATTALCRVTDELLVEASGISRPPD